MTDLDIPEIAAYRAKCTAAGRAPADISRLLRPDALQPHWPSLNAELFARQSLDMAMAALALAQQAVERAQRRLAAVREGENR